MCGEYLVSIVNSRWTSLSNFLFRSLVCRKGQQESLRAKILGICHFVLFINISVELKIVDARDVCCIIC